MPAGDEQGDGVKKAVEPALVDKLTDKPDAEPSKRPLFPPSKNPEAGDAAAMVRERCPQQLGLCRPPCTAGLLSCALPHWVQCSPPPLSLCLLSLSPLSPLLPAFSPPAQSKEDIELKERLELAVERLKDADPQVQRLALELLRKEIRESTR
jgi:hypothetical protein